jgi:hypothetical protein
MKETGHASRFRAMFLRGSLLVMTAVVALSFGCKKPTQEVSKVSNSFATPESAGQAVYSAAKSGDTNAVLAIFGQDAKELLVTGDATQDKEAFEKFAAEYEKMHRWGNLEGGALVLDVGVENYPFPFPLVKNSDGKWAFNTEEAKNEFLARRIGENELTVIGVLDAMAEAQTEYLNTTHDGSKVKQYAQKFVSSEGMQDGLYWKVAEGQPESPLGPLAARASAEGYKGAAESPEPFHGYFYRILTQQSSKAQGGVKNYIVNGNMTRGFAFLAYPAEYRKSGVMTFIVNQDRVVYQKDLGPNTVNTAKAISPFDPDDGWSVVE